MNVNCVFVKIGNAHLRGTTLPEACLAFSLIMVTVLGCLSTVQMAIKMRQSIETKTRALMEMENLANALRRTVSKAAQVASLNATRTRLEKQLPGSHLFWTEDPAERGYQICFLWTTRDVHRIKFLVIPGDFR